MEVHLHSINKDAFVNYNFVIKGVNYQILSQNYDIVHPNYDIHHFYEIKQLIMAQTEMRKSFRQEIMTILSCHNNFLSEL